MKVLSLNVRGGGGKRWGAILEFVDKHDPDIAVFTEWRRDAASVPLKAWASMRRLQWVGACDGATANGLAVAAKTSFDWVSVTPRRDSVGTMLRAEMGGWTMLAAYFPQGTAKHPYFDVIRDLTQECIGRPLLTLGDLNTGNQVADKTPEGVKFACAERFDRLSSIEGLSDLWRLTNGVHAREWTWRTSKNGFRIDHAFGNPEFVRQFRPLCRYDHTPREARFSDHSALLVFSTS
jgi:exonuclease III